MELWLASYLGWLLDPDSVLHIYPVIIRKVIPYLPEKIRARRNDSILQACMKAEL
jgi:hypothetical protein|uniref:Uncharacterized protein n=1 Tax=Picea sitchensis TaxID=3332 RepID=A0A6B9XVH7_PICSI|nr:hypothetical protein Q903MT_gene4215 [Picea sitchensis]